MSTFRTCFYTFICSLILAAQTAPSRTWTLTTAPNSSYTSIASSAGGSTLIAGSQVVYISTNGGASWDTAPDLPGGYWTKVTASADGSRMAALNYWSWIYVSKDGGSSWTQVAAESNFWQSIAFSADGMHLVAASAWDSTNQNPGHIYISSDDGVNWNPSDTTGYWTSVASSADGARLSAIASGAGIFISTNSGSQWVPTSAPNQNWCSVASSATGLKLAAAASDGPIYLSGDGGGSWRAATNAPNTNWTSVSLSSDGTRLAAVQSTGQVYISEDAGITWTTDGIPDDAQGYGWTVSQSADGSRTFAIGIGPHSGLVYVLQPIPSLDIIKEPTNLVVAWPTNAVGFYLEQTSDLGLANWTNTPTPSQIISGRNCVILDCVPTNQFLRLQFPTGTLPLGGRPPPILPPPPL